MIKFNRTEVANFILSKSLTVSDVTLAITGCLGDGALFNGSSLIKVRMPGDNDLDGRIDMKDVGSVARAFGSKVGDSVWNPVLDENEDEQINMMDVGTVARHFGEHYP